jgi:hypothetical protein
MKGGGVCDDEGYPVSHGMRLPTSYHTFIILLETHWQCGSPSRTYNMICASHDLLCSHRLPCHSVALTFGGRMHLNISSLRVSLCTAVELHRERCGWCVWGGFLASEIGIPGNCTKSFCFLTPKDCDKHCYAPHVCRRHAKAQYQAVPDKRICGSQAARLTWGCRRANSVHRPKSLHCRAAWSMPQTCNTTSNTLMCCEQPLAGRASFTALEGRIVAPMLQPKPT